MSQNELAIRFLLGKVTDDERSDIEQGFFQSTSAFEDILIAENALTDAYVCDRLPPEDRRLYEDRLLISPAQRKRAAFAETLVRYASRLPQDELAPSSRASRSALAGWGAFSLKPLLSYALTAAVVFVVVGVTLWWGSDDHRPPVDEVAIVPVADPTETGHPGDLIQAQPTVKDPEIAATISTHAANAERREPKSAHPDKPVQPTRSSGSIATIVLSLGSMRDGGAVKLSAIPKNVTSLRLQLGLEGEEFSRYFAIIETVDGQQMWRGKATSAGRGGKSPAVSFTVPAYRMRTGDYIVTLKGSSKGGTFQTVGEYTFSVERP